MKTQEAMEPQHDAKLPICKLGESWCEAMMDRLNPDANSHAKGLTTIILTSRTKGTSRLAGVAYRMGPKDKGLMLNYCPWCREPIEEDSIADQATKAAESEAR